MRCAALQLSDVKGMKPVAMAPPPQQLNAGAPPLMAGAAPLPFQQHFEAGPKPMVRATLHTTPLTRSPAQRTHASTGTAMT